MTEARILDEKQTGKMVNRNWHDYKLPTALDVPVKMESLPIELEDTEANTTGAKGLGEPVTIPTAAAIANAVYHATGIRVTTTPINPMKLSQLAFKKPEGGMTHAHAKFSYVRAKVVEGSNPTSFVRGCQDPCRRYRPPRLSSRRYLWGKEGRKPQPAG